MLAEQRDRAESRSSQIMDIEGELPDMNRNPNLDETPKLLERRGGAFSLANPLIARYSSAEPLLAALLEANRDRLPRFYPTG